MCSAFQSALWFSLFMPLGTLIVRDPNIANVTPLSLEIEHESLVEGRSHIQRDDCRGAVFCTIQK